MADYGGGNKPGKSWPGARRRGRDADCSAMLPNTSRANRYSAPLHLLIGNLAQILAKIIERKIAVPGIHFGAMYSGLTGHCRYNSLIIINEADPSKTLLTNDKFMMATGKRYGFNL